MRSSEVFFHNYPHNRTHPTAASHNLHNYKDKQCGEQSCHTRLAFRARQAGEESRLDGYYERRTSMPFFPICQFVLTRTKRGIERNLRGHTLQLTSKLLSLHIYVLRTA